MPVCWRMLGLDVRLVSDLGVGLRLMPDLDVGLGCGCGFLVVNRRSVGGMRSGIRVWGWSLELGFGYPGAN